MSVSRALLAGALALIGAVALAACSPRSSPDVDERAIDVEGEMVSETSLREAVTGLCAAQDFLTTDPLAARDAFYSRSHDRLHTIAAAVQEVDRADAASLLQAKAVVEEDLSRFPFPTSIAADLERLTTATRTALETLSIRTGPC